jgi:hypothetical protein
MNMAMIVAILWGAYVDRFPSVLSIAFFYLQVFICMK